MNEKKKEKKARTRAKQSERVQPGAKRGNQGQGTREWNKVQGNMDRQVREGNRQSESERGKEQSVPYSALPKSLS